MLSTPDPADIPGLLRRSLGSQWDLTMDGDLLQVQHRRHATPYRPPRRALPWPELLASLESAFADQGVPRAACLPLRWGRETELTISAVQALDPVLKHGRAAPYRWGFLPQPVVRLTGRRGADGSLLDGFLTSFVNVSRVEPIDDLSAFAGVFDQLLTVLSRLSLHARHVSLYGRLTIWRRRQVQGVTLRFRHAGMPLGDVVLLWNADRPDRLAIDLGTSLERLAWARGRSPWASLVFGPLGGVAPPSVLDAIRTATLLIGQGIPPAARGAGSITRRVAQNIPARLAALGLGAAVREYHQYWHSVDPLTLAWADVAAKLEREASRQG